MALRAEPREYDILAREYAAALREYVSGGGEAALMRAYEMGRKAVGTGVGIVELAIVHQEALDQLSSSGPGERSPVTLAAQFLAESLSPFEMALRAYEANVRLLGLSETAGSQNAEIDRAREQLQTILDATTAVIYLKDLEHRFVFVNRQFEELFSVRRKDVIGKTDLDVLSQTAAQTLRTDDRDVLEARTPRELEETVPIGNAPHTYLALKVPLVDVAGEPYGICSVATDITERKRAESALRLGKEAAENRERVLLEVNNAIVSNLSRDALFQAIFLALRKVISFDRANLMLADHTRGVSTVQAIATGWERAELPIVLPIGAEIPHEGSPTGRVLQEAHPIVIRDSRQEPVAGPFAQKYDIGIRSGIMAPLLTRRGTIGTVNVASLTPNHYTEQDAEFLTEAGKQVAVAIENMLAYEEIATLRARLEQENLYLQEEAGILYGVPALVGDSAAIRKVVRAIETVAPTDATVLITGETGTGKELIARAIHNLSPRSRSTMVKVNCAALHAGLIESELFGHEKGAFTGALARKIGRFELAHRGTILLDEIGDLPPELQAKLLRVLQEGEFERVGGTQPITVDVRVVAATNRNLEEAIREGRFRSDLYYRLSVFPIAAPPLRDRKEDVPPLVRHLVMKCSARLGKRIETILPADMAALERYRWPGNVRELENVIERAVIVSRGARLELGDRLLRSPTGPREPAATLEEVEGRHIRDVLETTGWQVSGERGAARILGVKPTTLESRMKKLGINRPTGNPDIS